MVGAHDDRPPEGARPAGVLRGPEPTRSTGSSCGRSHRTTPRHLRSAAPTSSRRTTSSSSATPSHASTASRARRRRARRGAIGPYPSGVFLLNGRVGGHWRRTFERDADRRRGPLLRVSRSGVDTSAVEKAAADLGRFHGLPAQVEMRLPSAAGVGRVRSCGGTCASRTWMVSSRSLSSPCWRPFGTTARSSSRRSGTNGGTAGSTSGPAPRT